MSNAYPKTVEAIDKAYLSENSWSNRYQQSNVNWSNKQTPTDMNQGTPKNVTFQLEEMEQLCLANHAKTVYIIATTLSNQYAKLGSICKAPTNQRKH